MVVPVPHPCVVGSKTWRKKQHKGLIGNVAACSNKTFVLLSLENSYKRWLGKVTWIVDNMDKEPQDHGPKNFRDSIYTNSGQSKKNGQSRCLQGWAREGYLRFNMLYTLVEQDRFKRANFESKLMLMWQTAAGKDKQTTLSVNTGKDDDKKFPANDFEGVGGSSPAI
jgi:hypothetical protein